MKILIQRVLSAKVIIDNQIISEILEGILLFTGFCEKDEHKSVQDFCKIINKILRFRIFEDDKQKMNLSLQDIKGSILIISQFTLCADPYQGNRPSFAGALEISRAKKLYENFINLTREEYKKIYEERYYEPFNNKLVQSGIFQSDMKIHLVNDGPVTFILEF